MLRVSIARFCEGNLSPHALLNKRRASRDFSCLYLLGKIKNALPRCESVLREAKPRAFE